MAPTKDNVGTASVTLEAVLDEESVAKIAEQIQNAAGDAAPVSERPGKRGRGRVTGGAADIQAEVTPKLVKDIGKDVRSSIERALESDWFDIQIDVPSIRKQVELALARPFEITLNAEVRGAAAQFTSGTARSATPMGPERGAAPRELMDMLSHVVQGKGRQQYAFAGGIDAIYRNINEALETAGKGRFGRQPLEPGNQVDKALELIDTFGDKVEDWVKFTGKGPIQKPSGGSILEFLQAEGLSPEQAKLGITNIGAMGGDNRRQQELFFARLSNWARTEAPAPAATEQVAKAAVVATKAADPLAQTRVQAAETQTREAKEAIVAERQESLRMSRLDPSRFAGAPGGPMPGARPLTTSDDIEADIQARRQLGVGERANVRRRGRRVPLENVGGLTPNLEPFLRLAAMGGFSDVFEQFTGEKFNESQGMVRFEAQDVGGFSELGRLRGLKPGIKRQIAGQEGKFTKINPSEAFARSVIGSLGIGEGTGAGDVSATIEAIRGFMDQPEVAQQIRLALDRGQAPLRGVSGATKRGQGAPIMTGTADLGAQAKRLFEFIDMLDGKIASYGEVLDRINQDIERSAGSGDRGRTQGLEEQARDLAKGIQRFRTQRTEAIREKATIEAEPPGLTRTQVRARSEAARGVVAAGVGLTPAERAFHESSEAGGQRGIFGPTAVGGRTRDLVEAGMLPDPAAIQAELVQRYLADRDRPEGQTGYRTLKQTAYGATSRPRKAGTERDPGGLYTELLEMLPADMGRTQRSEAEAYIRDILGGVVSNEGFVRGLAEEKIKGREGLTRPPLPKKTTASAIVTDEGISRVAFDKTQTGEGQFLGLPPGVAGRTQAGIARNREIRAREAYQAVPGFIGPKFVVPKESEYPFEPNVEAQEADLERTRGVTGLVEAEREKASRTRQRTLGSPRSPGLTGLTSAEILEHPERLPAPIGSKRTGDAARQMAREMGVTMEGEETGAPFAAFNARERAISSALAGATGAGVPPRTPPPTATGGDRFGESGGPVHVIVDNVPLPISWEGAAPATGGRKPRGRVIDEETGQPIEQAAGPAVVRATKTAKDPIEAAMERDFVAALRSQNDPRAMRAYEARVEGREQRYLTGATPTAAEKDFLAALQTANDPRREAVEQRRADAQRAAEVRQLRRTARINDPIGFAGAQDIEDIRQRELRGQLRSINRRVPRRGFGASITDLITSLAPGSGALEQQLEAADLATREATEISQASTRRAQTRTTRRGLIGQIRAERVAGRGGGEREAALIDQYREQIAAGRAQTAVINESTKRFKAFHEEATRGTTVLKSFGAAAAGSVVSTGIGAFTFGLGSAIAAPIITAVATGLAEAVGPAFERATGYAGTTGRVTLAAAQEIRARGGDAGAFAGQAARTGISAAAFERVSPLIIQRAEVEAGNQALKEQLDLLHAAENLARDQQGRTVDRGISETTGGFLGTPLFGIPGTAELVRNQLLGVGTEQPVDPGFLRGGAGSVAVNQLRGGNVGRDPIGDWLFGNAGASPQIERGLDRLKFFNDAAEKGGEALLRLVPATEEQARASANLARDVGLFPLAEQLEKTGTAVQGAVTGQDIQKLLAAINRGAITPSPELLLQDTARQRNAQIQLEDTQRRFQVETVNPQTFALGRAAQPLPPAGAGIGFSPADDPEVIARVNQGLGETQKLHDQINTEVQSGLDAAQAFVQLRLPEVAGDFANALAEVQAVGKQISGIQIGLQTKQAAFAAAQFTVQINLAKRALQDAKGLAGEAFGADNLGANQRQQFFLGRESQQLGFGRTQRQINFQVAQAGFTAPGLTAEERTARIAAAKQEAEFAQKQLDIQEKIFALAGRAFDIQGDRGVTDAGTQLDLALQGRELSLDTAAAQEQIAALSLSIADEQKEIETLYGAAVQRQGDIFNTAAELAAATGEAMFGFVDDAIDAWTQFYTRIGAAFETNQLGGRSGGRSPDERDEMRTPRHGGVPPDERNALGKVSSGVGMTHGAAIMGEAAGEAYAILKDPKMVPSPMGGGGSNFVFQITIQGDANEKNVMVLAQEVARIVESKMNDRAGMLLRVGG